jgi:hypothetical protein
MRFQQDSTIVIHQVTKCCIQTLLCSIRQLHVVVHAHLRNLFEVAPDIASAGACNLTANTACHCEPSGSPEVALWMPRPCCSAAGDRVSDQIVREVGFDAHHRNRRRSDPPYVRKVMAIVDIKGLR